MQYNCKSLQLINTAYKEMYTLLITILVNKSEDYSTG